MSLITWNPIEIKRITISQTNIWDGETGDIEINFDAEISAEADENTVFYNGKYVIYVNSFTAEGTFHPHERVTSSIPKSVFNLGDNTLSITVIDEEELGNPTSFEYNIIKEDRDTFTFERRFQHDLSPTTTGDVQLKAGEGLTVIEGVGTVSIQIPTEGKAKLKSITVEQDNEGEEVIEIIEDMTYLQEEGGGKIYEYPIDLSRFKDILDIRVYF